MKSYCVKEKKQTDCVPGTERYERAKNGRMMMKCRCASCGVIKTQFIRQQKGKGVGEEINKGISKKIPGFSEMQKVYTMLPGVDKTLLDQYWSGDIAKRAFDTKTGLFGKTFWSPPKDDKKQARNPQCNQIVWDPKIQKYVNKYC